MQCIISDNPCTDYLTPHLSAVGTETRNEIKSHWMLSRRAHTGHMAIKATGYTNVAHYQTADAPCCL